LTNGKGKSSIVRVLLGIHKPTGGGVLLDGEEITGSGMVLACACRMAAWKSHTEPGPELVGKVWTVWKPGQLRSE
jgi:ABC-type cobalamin/Fe3+-siderophores transport system ATPase subunit